ncbi:PilW family protein [Brevibacillus sp. SYSU BS000544]|uniref:PilW family protein n=1 Tax=Brevibacillus sp. SYSU BS000544 TaxID=3416443 RepID=UPI003CE4BF57
MRSSIIRYLRNENGLTLVEMLASVTIFVLIFIPLSSVYIRGVELYQKTQEQTQLRNEADFVIGDIMRIVQEATYFELSSTTSTNRQTLLNIFSHPKAGTLITAAEAPNYNGNIIQYTRSNVYDEATNRTNWLLTRAIYQFQLPASPSPMDHAFVHSPNYLVGGLFRISPDNKQLTLCLVIAPRGDQAIFDQEGQQKKFTSFDEIVAELDNTNRSDQVNSYIRFVRTDFAVNNVRRGE